MKKSNSTTASSKKKKTLVILDAHAIIHRAYHALPSFTNSAGEPTGALYGVTTMTLKIIETFNPDYIVAAFDLPKPTFRHHAYDAYKKGRAKLEDALISQLQSARTLFETFNITVLDAEGFEADDVIGTLVEQYKNDPHLNIVIASGDMDTMQLIEGSKTQVFTLKKGVNDTILYDEDAVRARFGFGPLQLVDYKGLRGDASDNIIGVPGIGEKTATTILATFGSLEHLYESLEKDRTLVLNAGVSERMVSILETHKEDAFFSKTLATIRRDTPITYELPELSYKATVDGKKLLDLFQFYEFKTLSARVQKLFALTPETAPKEDINTALLLKCSIALWVLYSEHTTPDYETVLQQTKATNLTDAWSVIEEKLKKAQAYEIFAHLEEPLIPIVSRMEERGILVDEEHLLSMQRDIGSRQRVIEKSIKQIVGVSVNLNSPKQLSTLLFDTLALKTKGKRKESGAFTTNAETLELLRDEHPVIPLILEYREIQKILSSYVESLLRHKGSDNRVHAKFYQHGTTTGRFSSSDPNLQTIPATGVWGNKVRHAFVAAPNSVFIACDYSQIELRVLAMLSKDTLLIESFERGDDIHTSVASRVFHVPPEEVTKDMRRNAKVINFGILYGMGISALQKNLGTTREHAQQFYTDYFAAFPTIQNFLDNARDLAKQNGFTETAFGRRRYFPTINVGAPFLRAFAERMASNAPIQGTAADIIKLAIIAVEESLRRKGLLSKAHLVLQVHDELVYEVDLSVQAEVEECIKVAMLGVIQHSPIALTIPTVPLAVSCAIGTRLDNLS